MKIKPLSLVKPMNLFSKAASQFLLVKLNPSWQTDQPTETLQGRKLLETFFQAQRRGSIIGTYKMLCFRANCVGCSRASHILLKCYCFFQYEFRWGSVGTAPWCPAFPIFFARSPLSKHHQDATAFRKAISCIIL